MTKFLRRYDALIFFIAPFFLILGTGFLVFADYQVEVSVFTNLNVHYFAWIEELGWLSKSLSAILFLGFVIMFNRMAQVESLLGKLSNLPIFIATVLYFVIPAEANSPIFWLGCIVQMLLLKEMLKVFNGNEPNRGTFNAGFLVGILSVISPFTILLLFPMFQSLGVVSKLTLRRMVMGVFGLIVPWYLINAVLFLAGGALIYPNMKIASNWSLDSTSEVIYVGLLLLLITTTAINASMQHRKTTIREKRKWFLVTMYLIVGMFSFFAFNTGLLLFGLFIPWTLAFSRTLLFLKNSWIGDILLLVLIGLIYLNNFL